MAETTIVSKDGLFILKIKRINLDKKSVVFFIKHLGSDKGGTYFIRITEINGIGNQTIVNIAIFGIGIIDF